MKKKHIDFIINFYTFLFARKSFSKLNYFLYDLVLKSLGVGNCKKYNGEKWVSNLMLKEYNCKIIFDVGANVGTYAKNFSHYKDTIIYCFEPHPNTYNRLKQNVNMIKNIHTYNFGLSDQHESLILYDHATKEGTTGASMYKEVVTELRNNEVAEIEINLNTLDNFINENNINNIDLLKIDVEGNELKVLQGAKETLKRFKIKIIQFEFNEINIYSRSFFKDFFNILPEYNFYRLLPKSLLPLMPVPPKRTEIYAYQNIIAIRKEFDKN